MNIMQFASQPGDGALDGLSVILAFSFAEISLRPIGTQWG